MNYDLFISRPEKVTIYEINVPDHLKGITNTEELRESDLEKLS